MSANVMKLRVAELYVVRWMWRGSAEGSASCHGEGK